MQASFEGVCTFREYCTGETAGALAAARPAIAERSDGASPERRDPNIEAFCSLLDAHDGLVYQPTLTACSISLWSTITNYDTAYHNLQKLSPTLTAVHLTRSSEQSVLSSTNITTMAARAQATVGSAAWIAAEKENALQLLEQEKEEVIFPAQHEMEWLNEHMSEIFSKTHL